MKTFTILGTGWLGFELAKQFKNYYKVKVSSRNEEKFIETPASNIYLYRTSHSIYIPSRNTKNSLLRISKSFLSVRSPL